ncbi:hypothetical protein C0J52_01613 [Blattella germanica]|nr:hypothetical protein C0J52_01613 [Blattella germanica]
MWQFTHLNSKQVLHDSFPVRLISRFRDEQRPDRSSYLTAADFFLWDNLKEKSLHHLEQLKERVRDAIREVQPETLPHVMNNIQSLLQQCVQNDGAHLIDVLFKKLTVCLTFQDL